jgi:NAD kinase
MNFENVIVITGKTRLDQLIERFNTKAQARFYIEHSGGNFREYEEEDVTFRQSLEEVLKVAGTHARMKLIERKFLPNFLFSEQDIVVAIGQDGLVANVAKYIHGQPLIGVNPDPLRNDGVLLPFSKSTFEKGLLKVLEQRFAHRHVTMAQAKTNDGQTMLAFNDLFIGPSTHTSARYCLNFRNKSENQSSSGIIVSTGAGSTGWLSSVVNMSNGVFTTFQATTNTKVALKMKWNDNKLIYIVREPFLSKHSQINLTAGVITASNSLKIDSQMPFNGVIFSDGIEADYLQFNSGCQVEITVADNKAMIVQP